VAAADEEAGVGEEEEQAGAAAEEVGAGAARRRNGGGRSRGGRRVEEAGWGRIRLRLGHKLGLILELGCLMGF